MKSPNKKNELLNRIRASWSGLLEDELVAVESKPREETASADVFDTAVELLVRLIERMIDMADKLGFKILDEVAELAWQKQLDEAGPDARLMIEIRIAELKTQLAAMEARS